MISPRLRTYNSELQIFRLLDQKLLSTIDGVDCLQSILSIDPPKRSTTREKLVEAVVADLGDSYNSQPYLIVCIYLEFVQSLLT